MIKPCVIAYRGDDSQEISTIQPVVIRVDRDRVCRRRNQRPRSGLSALVEPVDSPADRRRLLVPFIPDQGDGKQVRWYALIVTLITF